MDTILNDFWTNDLYRKFILSILVILIQFIIRYPILTYVLNRIPADSPHLYPVRKVTSYLVTIIAALLLFGIWVERLSDLSVAIGIFAAGIAFALQEVIGSIAGWITIIIGRPFTIGDRIESGGIRGDVVDISVLRTTLMEIGNWLNGDHNTGRIVTLSNSFLFKEPVYNYSAHLRFVWDEIRIPITYTSNSERAVEIMSNSVRDHPAYKELLPLAEKQRQDVRRKLVVKITSLQPRTFVKLTDNWIELGLVYPVDTDLRRTFRSDISKQLLVAFKSEGITIASQTIALVSLPEDSSSTKT